MDITPFPVFKKWYAEELKITSSKIPSACCLSTNGTDGFPNARFVSLKDLVDDHFIITGTLTSRKGIEISASDKVALTFWWTNTERQVRIQGTATPLPDDVSNKYFSERTRDSQMVSIVSEQGQEIDTTETLTKKYDHLESEFTDLTLHRPDNWGGYKIAPIRMEFLEFKSTRFHDRKLYELIMGHWIMKQLQP